VISLIFQNVVAPLRYGWSAAGETVRNSAIPRWIATSDKSSRRNQTSNQGALTALDPSHDDDDDDDDNDSSVSNTVLHCDYAFSIS